MLKIIFWFFLGAVAYHSGMLHAMFIIMMTAIGLNV